MIKKYQYGGPGYFLGNDVVGGIKKAVRKGSQAGLNLLGWLGNGINTVITSGASTDFGLTSPFVNLNRLEVAKGREQTRLKAKKAIEQASSYISPSNHIVAWTQGSFNPLVGQLKLVEWGPEALLLGAGIDIATFAKGPKTVKAVRKSKTSKGNVKSSSSVKGSRRGLIDVGGGNVMTPAEFFNVRMKSIPDNLILDKNVEVNPFSDLHTVQDVSHFTPRVKAGIGKFNEMYGEETINRLKDLGYEVDNPYPIVERGFRNMRYPSSVIRENSKRPVYLGTFDESTSRMGEYHTASDVAIADPTLSKNLPSVMLHERNMHGTDKVIEGFADAGKPKAKNMYQDFLDKLFVREVKGEHVNWKEPAPGIERVGDNSYVIDYGNGMKYPMAKGTNLWYEGRSTINELKRKYLYDEWKKAGKPATLEEVRPLYLKRIEGLSEGELLSDLANETNGYGQAYVALRKNNPTFIPDLKELLKHGAGYVAPIGGGYMLYNKVNSLKQGGKMDILEFLKNGSGIHIKEKNKGKFTSYCGGKVTDECILKGKKSPNATIRKRSTFADNARHFKHRSGGSFKGYPSKAAYNVRLEEVAGFKKGGKAFVNGVSVLDSNPDAYKYVKKKYKMRSALQGTKLGLFLNSDLGLFAISTVGLLYDGIKNQSNYNKFLKLNKERIKSGKEAIINNVGDVSLEATEYLNQLKLLNPDVNYSLVDLGLILQLIANKRKLENMLKANQWELDLLQQLNSLINAIQGNSGIGDILSKGLGLIGDYYLNKNSTKNNYIKPSTKNLFSGSMLNTDPKTFFNLT